MKKYAFYILLSIVSRTFLLAQQCVLNTTTSTSTAGFNWWNHGEPNLGTSVKYDIYYKNKAQNTQSVKIKTPWETPNRWNIKQFYDALSLNKKIDNLPTDGWELIQYDLGTSVEPTTNPPYLIIYNKYTGILRVFVYMPGDIYSEQTSGAYINLRFDGDFSKSALLATADKELLSMEDFTNVNQLAVANKYYTAQTDNWFMADFPMTYDPCTCHNPTYNDGLKPHKLLIDVYFIDVADVSLISTITGTLESDGVASNTASGGVNINENSFASIIGNISANTSVNVKANASATVSYKSSGGFQNSIVNRTKIKTQSPRVRKRAPVSIKYWPEYEKVKSQSQSSNVISVVASAAIGGEATFAMEAIGLLSYFISESSNNGSSSGSIAAQEQTQYLNATATTQGTITQKIGGSYISLFLPGSNKSTILPDNNKYFRLCWC